MWRCRRKAWQTACERAGCPGRIPHDFRRTAVRTLVLAGPWRLTIPDGTVTPPPVTPHPCPGCFTARYEAWKAARGRAGPVPASDERMHEALPSEKA